MGQQPLQGCRVLPRLGLAVQRVLRGRGAVRYGAVRCGLARGGGRGVGWCEAAAWLVRARQPYHAPAGLTAIEGGGDAGWG